jgi:hypothetical protein
MDVNRLRREYLEEDEIVNLRQNGTGSNLGGEEVLNLC